MKELEVWEHQAGWGFVGITSGIIFGPLCVLVLHLAKDPSIYQSWSSAFHAIWLELVVAIFIGWFIGAISAWMFYNSAAQKNPTIFRRSANGIAKLSFILIFILASIYYVLVSPDKRAYPIIFWLTGVVGIFISGRIGSVIASRLLKGAEE